MKIEITEFRKHDDYTEVVTYSAIPDSVVIENGSVQFYVGGNYHYLSLGQCVITLSLDDVRNL